MAFPVNGILDNFNRVDAATIGSNWTIFSGASGDDGITSNTVYNFHAINTNYNSMYWNPSTFGPDCEAYLSMPTKNSTVSGDSPAVFARGKTPGAATFSAYYVGPNGGANTVAIQRVDNGVTTTLGAAISQTVTSGDKFGMSVVGSTITAYYNTAGTWNSIGTRTDTTYAAAGSIGLYLPGNTVDGRWDDFGGGTISSAVVPTGFPSNTISQPINFDSAMMV